MHKHDKISSVWYCWRISLLLEWWETFTPHGLSFPITQICMLGDHVSLLFNVIYCFQNIHVCINWWFVYLFTIIHCMSQTLCWWNKIRVPTLSGKPWNVHFTLPCLNKAWNLLKSMNNLKFWWQKLEFCKFNNQFKFIFQKDIPLHLLASSWK